jgi:hypothetical protein
MCTECFYVLLLFKLGREMEMEKICRDGQRDVCNVHGGMVGDGDRRRKLEI